MNNLVKVALFFLGSIGIIWVSRGALRNPRSHGFYRFFAWEGILALFLLNVDYWVLDPFNAHQIVAWLLLVLSLVLIILGVRAFRSRGKPDPGRADPSLVGIEKTTELVTDGIYGAIRHPFYSSLLLLVWGIFFKKPGWIGFVIAACTSGFLIATAKVEEQENIFYFGGRYQRYMERTRMFIPFIF